MFSVALSDDIERKTRETAARILRPVATALCTDLDQGSVEAAIDQMRHSHNESNNTANIEIKKLMVNEKRVRVTANVEIERSRKAHEHCEQELGQMRKLIEEQKKEQNSSIQQLHYELQAAHEEQLNLALEEQDAKHEKHLKERETRHEKELDLVLKLLKEQDAKHEKHIKEQDSKYEKHLKEQDAKYEKRLKEQDDKYEEHREALNKELQPLKKLAAHLGARSKANSLAESIINHGFPNHKNTFKPYQQRPGLIGAMLQELRNNFESDATTLTEEQKLSMHFLKNHLVDGKNFFAWMAIAKGQATNVAHPPSDDLENERLLSQEERNALKALKTVHDLFIRRLPQ